MQLRKDLIIKAIITVFLSAVFAVFARYTVAVPAERGYAVLAFDPQNDDASLVSRLHAGGLGGIQAVSTQTVFLDDFGEMREIPLEKYRELVNDFDLRNDGYAGKLESFFYQDGKRLVFVPLEGNFRNSFPGKISKEIGKILGSTLYELHFLGAPGPQKLPWILFIIALGSAAWFFRDLRQVFFVFFPASLFIFLGPPGFVMIALLGAFISLIMRPLGEYITSGYFHSRKTLKEHLSLYRASWIPAGILALLYGAVMFLSGVFLPWGISGFIGVSGLCVFSLSGDIRAGASREHIRFMPVPISPGKGQISFHLMRMLPFCLAGLLLLVSAFFIKNTYSDFNMDPGKTLSPGEFEGHLEFQRNFSYNPLVKKPVFDQYRRYTIGGDGLISGSEPVFPGGNGQGSPVVFPLGDLTAQILGQDTRENSAWMSPGQLIPLFCSLFLALPFLYVKVRERGRKKMITMYNDKRIAA